MEIILGAICLIRPEMLAVLCGVLILGPDGVLWLLSTITISLWLFMMKVKLS